MEFFAIAAIPLDAERLQRETPIAALPGLCASIERCLEDQGERGSIYCVWGTFTVIRIPIRGGVRFLLPGCPNALTWSLTTGHPPEPDGVVIHCVINRVSQEPDLIESIETFVQDWRRGLEGLAIPP